MEGRRYLSDRGDDNYEDFGIVIVVMLGAFMHLFHEFIQIPAEESVGVETL